MGKMLAGGIAIIIIVGGAWYFWNSSSARNNAAGAAASQSGTSGTSDQDISNDMSTVDAQVQAAVSADADAQNTTDTPVQQTE